MNRRSLLRLAGTALALRPLAGPARAGEEHGRYVLSLMRELITLSEQASPDALRPRLVRVLNARADVQSISMFALGTWRKRLPASLRNDYMRLTVEYTANAFIGYVDHFQGAKVRLDGSEMKGGIVTVSAILTYAGGKDSEIRFRFAERGGLRVKDVNVQGVWLSLRLRDQFGAVLSRSNGDYAALMDFLREGAA